jgi:hypothetical protein|tara:strand:+ start:69 stop:908 length:840 start_codon:yes stop_codon:yes gene_type:complete
MKQTNLSVELTYVTPELAENYLRFNNKNRNVGLKNIEFLVSEMRNGRFIENGESIVFDKNGALKDGQHRLLSIVKSGKSYFIPVVRGVEPIAMATYDTGKNRSASDILSLNGFKDTNTLSAFILAISKYSKNKSKSKCNAGDGRSSKLTNQQVLEYCESNYHWLNKIINKLNPVYKKSNPKTISLTGMCLITYLVGGKEPSIEVYEFISHLMGLSRTQETAPNYLYTKLYNSKINKEPLSFYWVLGMSIKAWNFYADGNPAVKHFRFDIAKDLPKALSI